MDAVIRAAQETIEASILLFATGHGNEQPSGLLESLAEQGLTSAADSEGAQLGTSIMLDNYDPLEDEMQEIADELESENAAVADTAFAAFKLLNDTYVRIKERVNELDTDLREITEYQDQYGNYLPLAASDELIALRHVFQAVEDVHTAVESASDEIEEHKDVIRSLSQPRLSQAAMTPTSSVPSARTVSSISASDISAGTGTADKVLAIAAKEVGVREIPGAANVVDRPYNINDLWCASFATWVWEQAGYDIKWTNKNYVPSIWADANSLDLAAPVTDARPGDMIIFDWQGDGSPDHIGIVESVTGDTITAIEGNSDDAVERKPYAANSADIFGIVKSPSDEEVPPSIAV